MPNTPTPTEDFVYALSLDANGIGFAARQSGLYRTDDGGSTWRSAYDNLDLAQSSDAITATTAVALSPTFAADGEVLAGLPGGILRSVDRGSTWDARSLPPPPPTVSSIVFSPDYEADGLIFFGTIEDGMFTSRDRGRHWDRWNFGLLDLNILTIAIAPDFATAETLYVGTETGIYRSTNGGRAWRDMPFPDEAAPVMALAVTSAGVIYAGTEEYGLYTSNNDGDTWEPVSAAELGESVDVLVADDDRLLISADDRLFITDGGTTLTPIPIDAGPGLSAVAAPGGLVTQAPLYVGRADGQVLKVMVPSIT